MLIIVLAIFIMMFCIGLYSSKSLFAPYTLMSGTWSVILSLYYILDHGFFEIQYKFPLNILLWGVCFFFSSFIAEAFTKSDTNFNKSLFSQRVIKAYYILLVISIPIMIYVTIKDVIYSDNIFLYLRIMNTGQDETIEKQNLGILPYFNSLLLVLYLFELIRFSDKNKITVYILLVVNLLMALITVAKTSFFTILIASMVILYKQKKITLKTILTSLFVFLLFSIFLQTIRSSEGEIDNSSFISSYLLSGSIAFDYTVVTNKTFGEYTFRFFYAIANAFGAKVNVAPTIYDYTSIPGLTNVYTVLYPYYVDFGVCGVAIMAIINGALSGFIYKKSLSGSVPFLIFYAIFATSVTLQFMGEFLFTNLSSYLQYLFYSFLPFYLKKI